MKQHMICEKTCSDFRNAVNGKLRDGWTLVPLEAAKLLDKTGKDLFKVLSSKMVAPLRGRVKS